MWDSFLSCTGTDKGCGIRRSVFWGSLTLFICATFLMSHNGPVGKHLFLFSMLYSGSFILLWLLYRTFPDEWSVRDQFIFILCTAILCRFFFLGFPASYDVNRYVWEGYLVNQDINPYLHAPSDPVLKPFVTDIWHNINHKDASACYPPMVILFFSVLSGISQSPLFFKSVIILFDIAVIPLLALMMRFRKIDLKYLIIYALNPLILVFIAGEGHLDAIHVFFICLSLYMLDLKKDGWSFFILGCAVMSKYYAIILFPFFVNSKNWKKAIILFVPFVSYLPFLDSGPELFSSLINFGTAMHYNDSMAVLLRLFFGSNAVLISLMLLTICIVFIFLVVHDTMRSSYLAFASLLIFLPTLHPWYLVLLTPFLVLFPSRAWLYLHFAVIFTFPVLSVESNTGIFQELYWLKGFEYLPFFTLLVFDFVKQRPFSYRRSFRPVKNISVVVPVLNESENISGALDSQKKEKGILETVVVDGGSSDNTREVAENLGAVVLEAERGRGLQ
ncbi:MAG: glycosyltransferase, partial [Deltaproteobacteria bacterium]|nr:glycosyltransferase [Deltaproteobacteria bacterium]